MKINIYLALLALLLASCGGGGSNYYVPPPSPKGEPFSGVLQSTRTHNGKTIAGPWKGSMLTPTSGIIAAHTNPKVGITIHTVTTDGKPITRTVTKVDNTLSDYDISVVYFDAIEEDVVIRTIPNKVPIFYRVQHQDGRYSPRYAEVNTMHKEMLYSQRQFTRPLVAGDSGLPWVGKNKTIIGHTYLTQYGVSPNYVVLKDRIEKLLTLIE